MGPAVSNVKQVPRVGVGGWKWEAGLLTYLPRLPDLLPSLVMYSLGLRGLQGPSHHVANPKGYHP